MNPIPVASSCNKESTRRVVAGLLAQRRLGLLNRAMAGLAARLARLKSVWAEAPRRTRRAWRAVMLRRAAPAAVGAALLLAMMMNNAGAATIAVANGAVAAVDDGVCSLVEAIDNANSTTTGQPHDDCAAGNPAGADTINLPAGGSFLLTTPVSEMSFDDNGLPIITGAVTINGNGATISRAAATPPFRIFAVDASGNLTVNNATVSGGDAPGSLGFGGGGGFIVKGRLELNGATVSGNDGNDGGGIFNYEGVVVINNSTLSDNYASNFAYFYWRGGGAINNWGELTITNSTLSGNRALGEGGAVHTYYPGTMTISDSVLSGNEASGGGAIRTGPGTTNLIERTTLSDNTADGIGGAMFTNGWVETIGSTISGNSALAGGGIHASSNHFVTNSTISGNSATRNGGGAVNFLGLSFSNTTITGNTAGWNGGGIYSGTPAFTAVWQSIVSGNDAADMGDEVYQLATSGGIIDDLESIFGHSGVSGTSGFTPHATSITPTEPLALILDPTPADNGGPTHTHALVAGSPAIDLASNFWCAAGSDADGIDQRGLPRNVNGKGGVTGNECDAGAYEAQSGPPPPPSASLYVSPAKGGTVGGISVAPQDILYRDGTAGTWAMHFDGSDVGVTKAISAFAHLPGGDLLLVLKAGQSLPGIGAVTPWDVVRFTPTSLGNTTAGTFSWYIDGSDVGLSGSGEKIDALEARADGRVLISTTGALSVPAGGGTLKSQDEDLTAFTPAQLGEATTGAWALTFDGTAVPGLKGEDVAGAHMDETTGELYVSITGSFTVGGVGGNGKDVLKLTPSGGGYTVTRHWRGGDHGFNLNIGGIELP